MFVKLISICTIFTFVYLRSVQCCESQTSTLVDSSSSNTHPTKTVSVRFTRSSMSSFDPLTSTGVCFIDGTKAGTGIQTARKLAARSGDCYLVASFRHATRKSEIHASRYETSEKEGNELQTKSTNRFTSRLLRIRL